MINENLEKKIVEKIIKPTLLGLSEIGSEYKELFEEYGGQKLDYVPSLNSNDSWVECIIDLVK